MGKVKKNNVKEKLRKAQCNISNNRIRYLLKKFGVTSLLEVRISILRDLKERLKNSLTDIRVQYKIQYKIWNVIICVVIANFAEIYDWGEIRRFCYKSL